MTAETQRRAHAGMRNPGRRRASGVARHAQQEEEANEVQVGVVRAEEEVSDL